MPRRAFPLPEVATMVGVSVKTLRREINDGNLQAKRLRGVTVVLHGALDRYLAGLPDEGHVRTSLSQQSEPTPLVRRGARVQRLINLADDDADVGEESRA